MSRYKLGQQVKRLPVRRRKLARSTSGEVAKGSGEL